MICGFCGNDGASYTDRLCEPCREAVSTAERTMGPASPKIEEMQRTRLTYMWIRTADATVISVRVDGLLSDAGAEIASIAARGAIVSALGGVPAPSPASTGPAS